MEEKYLEIESSVIQARKKLNALMGLRWGITLSISITLLYLALYFFGVMGMLQPWWLLVVANIAAGIGGLLWGRSREIRPQSELFQVDLSMNLGEKLTTIYELREMGWQSRILDALYQRIESIKFDPKSALGLSRSEKRGWVMVGGLLAGAFLLLFLWSSGVNPLNLAHLLDFLRTEQATITSRYFEEPNIQLDEPTRDLNSDGEFGEFDLEERTTRSCGDVGAGIGGRSEEACVEEEGSSQSSSTSLEQETREQQQRQQALQEMNQSLSDLLSQLEQGQMSAEDIQRELERMAGELREGALQESLDRAAQAANPQDLAEKLRESLEEVERQQDAEQERAESLAERREQQEANENENPDSANDSGETEPPPDSISTNPNESPGQQSDSGNQSDGQNDSQEPGSQESSESDDESSGQQTSQQSGQGASQPTEGNVEGGDQSAESSQQSEQGQANNESQTGESSTENPSGQNIAGSNQSQSSDDGGDEAGLGPGERGAGSEGDEIATNENLVIKGGDLPQDPELLERLITLGIPVDLEQAQGEESPKLVINYEKVEALLELRELPPNLRALVRSYFLAITREK
jgi:hypothetical protein